MDPLPHRIVFSIFCSVTWWLVILRSHICEPCSRQIDAVFREERALAGLAFVSVLGMATGVVSELPLLLVASIAGYAAGWLYFSYVLFFE